jgi:hypothetical protein
MKNENCKLALKRGVKVIVKLDEEEELKALPLLLHHSAGMILPNRTYILPEDALEILRAKCVRYCVVCREAVEPSLQEIVGERV